MDTISVGLGRRPLRRPVGDRSEIRDLLCFSSIVSQAQGSPSRYRAGVGVATALLVRNGVPVVSQRDHRTLARIRTLLDPGFHDEGATLDHHETDWYRSYFTGAR